jgi:FixJ family two-component response regulator
MFEKRSQILRDAVPTCGQGPKSFAPGTRACLILDIRMPGMSGLELQERLKAAGELLPIVVITGHGDVSIAVSAMKAGAVEFLQKPFNDQVLLDAVQSALTKYGRGIKKRAVRSPTRSHPR